MLRVFGGPRRADVRPGPEDGAPVQLLPRLTGLRAFAALAVFIFHLHHWDIVSLPWGVSQVGAAGVAFFFVLSGFVLAWGTRPGLPVRTFYRRRFARVYPSDLVVLLVAMVVPAVAVHRDVTAAIANAFMVQAWFADGDVVYGMNGVSWSLSCEAFFYAIFPVAALVVRRIPRRVSWALVLLGLGLAVVAYQLSPGRADHFPLIRVSEFLLGLVAGIAFRDGWRPRVPGVVVWCALLVAITGSVLIGTPVTNALLAIPFLLLILHVAGRDVAAQPGWLAGRALIFAGEASFAFYLVHELVIVNLLDVLPDRTALHVMLLSAVAVVAAVGLHLLVERPFNRLLRDRAPSLALTPAPAAGVAGRVDEQPPVVGPSASGARQHSDDG